jgi:phosphate starvation-inducible PhoH-like protein
MSPAQMKTLLTRIGEHSKFIISGDLDQSDKYRDYTKSGLYDAMTRHKNITDIGFVVFSDADIVRNPIIKKLSLITQD